MRAKPHPSPLSFSHSNYSRLLLILFPLLIAVTFVSAAVFVYYPVSITANWVNPPVTFFNPGTSGVAVSLYDDYTRAEVDVASPGVLTLARRHAFVWDDFSDASSLNRLTRNTPEVWSWESGGYIRVSADGQARDWGGERVAYYANDPVPNGANNVYVLVKEWHDTTAVGQYSGLTMIESSARFYTLEYHNENTGSIDIWRYRNGWNQLASSSLTLSDNVWRIFLGRRVVSSGAMSLTVYDSGGSYMGAVSATDTFISVTRVGVGIYDRNTDGNYLTAQFDDFVACYNANPSFVNVTGLAQGWTVYLKDSGGSIVASATAGPNGVASLNVLTRPIVRGASFEIRWNGYTILSQSFSEVVGGDVYSCNLRDMNILGFQNWDSKAYNVYLRVESLSVPSGYSGRINIWVGSGTATTPIQIVGGSIIQGTTSTITIGPYATNYIHGTFSLSPSTPVVLTLSFHYYLDGVEVEYPVTVRVHN